MTLEKIIGGTLYVMPNLVTAVGSYFVGKAVSKTDYDSDYSYGSYGSLVPDIPTLKKKALDDGLQAIDPGYLIGLCSSAFLGLFPNLLGGPVGPLKEFLEKPTCLSTLVSFFIYMGAPALVTGPLVSGLTAYLKSPRRKDKNKTKI